LSRTLKEMKISIHKISQTSHIRLKLEKIIIKVHWQNLKNKKTLLFNERNGDISTKTNSESMLGLLYNIFHEQKQRR
jgi:hypothetical protein